MTNSYFQIIQDGKVICEGDTADEAKAGADEYFDALIAMDETAPYGVNKIPLIVREVFDNLNGYDEVDTPWTLSVHKDNMYWENLHEAYLRSPYLTGRI